MVKVDFTNKVITVNGNTVTLSNPQWKILECFSHQEGTNVEKIAQKVYGSKIDKNCTTTSVTLSRIKKIVGDKNFIVKERSKNYVFHETVEVIYKEN